MVLRDEHCVPIPRGAPALADAVTTELAEQIPLWTMVNQALVRKFTCKDFRAAMAFVNRIADLAEAENHHPDIFISYNIVKLDLSTHKINGLSRNDFILAAKIDLLEN